MPGKSNVEERVVEMRIDHKEFESGAKKTIGVLEKLEKALHFKKETDGLDELEKSMGRFNDSSSDMLNGIEKISLGFSALEIVGMRVISNLTDGVYNFVSKTVKGLTIDQVTAGWNKYEKMIESTQTIMAATADKVGEGGTWATQEEQMAAINKYLEGLLWYADETSYSFTDMTDNLGKFLSAGVDLETAYKSMMGISSWGASAGAKAAEVGRAMYNISQAMGQGAMKAMDWKSIENANMATLAFKQTALEVAADLGKIVMVTDDIKDGFVSLNYVFDEFGNIIGKKDAKGNILEVTDEEIENALITAENFRETLSDGWLDKEVMEEVFSRYGEFAEVLRQVTDTENEIKDAEGNTMEGITGAALEATQMLQLLDEYRDNLANPDNEVKWDEWAEEAGVTEEHLKTLIKRLDDVGIAYSEAGFRMGQEAKTFTDAIDATKDAVSSQWMKTFEYIFGDYIQAKEFWTNVTGELWEIFAAGGDIRNQILKLWSRSVDENGFTGRDFLLGKKKLKDAEGNVIEFQGAFWNILDAIYSVIDPIKEAFAEVFGFDEGNVENAAEFLRNVTQRFQEFTAELGFSKEASQGLKTIFKGVFSVFKAGLKVVGAGVKVFSAIAQVVGEVVDIFFSLIGIFSQVGQEIDGEVYTWTNAFSELGERIKEIFDTSEGLTGIIKRIGGVLKGFLPDDKRLVSIITGIRDFLSAGWDNMLNAIRNFDITKLLPSWQEIGNYIERIKDYLKEAYPETYALFKQWRQTSVLGGAFQGLLDLFNSIWGAISGITVDTQGMQNTMQKVFAYISSFLGMVFGDSEEVKTRVSEFLNSVWDGILNSVKNIKFSDVLKALKGAGLIAIMTQIGGILNAFKKMLKSASGIPEAIIDLTTGAYGVLEGFEKKLKADAYFKIALALVAISAALIALTKVDANKLTRATVHLALLAVVIGMVVKSLSKLGKINSNEQFAGNTINVFSKLASTLIGLAAMFGGLALLIGISKNVDMSKLIAIMVSVGLLVAEIAVVVLLMKKVKFEDSKGVIFSFLAISFALQMLIPVLAVLAIIPGANAARSIFGVMGLLIALGGLAVLLDKFVKDGSNLMKAAGAMAIMALALDLLIPIITVLGLMPPGMFGKALASIFVMAAILGGMTALMAFGATKLNDKSAKNMIIMAAAMLIIAVAINVLVPAIVSLAVALAGITVMLSVMENFDEGLKRLAKLGGALLIFAAVIVAIGVGVSFLGKGMLMAGAGVLLFAAGLAVLAAVIRPLSEVLPLLFESLANIGKNWDENWVSILKGVGAFVLFAGAVALLVYALTKLFKLGDIGSKMSGIGKKMYTGFSGILKIFGTKIKEDLPKILPGILQALGAILTIVGLYLLGAIPTLSQYAVKAITVLFSSLAQAMYDNRQPLVKAISDIVAEIFAVIGGVIEESWKKMNFLGKAVSVIGAIFAIIVLAAKAIALIKGIGTAASAAGSAAAAGGAAAGGATTAAGGGFAGLIASLGGIATLGPIAVAVLAAIGGGILQAKEQANVADEAFVGLDKSTNGFIESIYRQNQALENCNAEYQALAECGGDLTAIDQELTNRRIVLNNTYKEFADTLGITTEELKAQIEAADGDIAAIKALNNVSVNDMSGVDEAKSEKFKMMSKNADEATASVETLSTSFADLNTLISGEGIDWETILTSYMTNGGLIPENLSTGIDDNTSLATGSITTLGTSMLSSLGTSLDGTNILGGNAVIGLANGAYAHQQDAYDAGYATGKSFMSGYDDATDTNSPSREMAKRGVYAIEGLIIGLKTNQDGVLEETYGIGSMMLNALSDAMAKVGLLASDEFTISPRITPIVDMSNVTNAAGYMDGALSRSYGVSANLSNSISRRMADVERVAAAANEGSSQTINGDNITFNIYASEGMDEEAVADAVMNRMSNRLSRRGVAFG